MPMPRSAIEFGSGTTVEENAWVITDSETPPVPPDRKMSFVTRIELRPGGKLTKSLGDCGVADSVATGANVNGFVSVSMTAYVPLTPF